MGGLGTTSRENVRVEPPHASLKAAAPFVAVGTIGFASVLLPPYGHGGAVEAWMVLAVLGVMVAVSVVSLRRTTRTWIDPVAPLLFFPLLALARDLTGGSNSGLAPLVALPIVWLALMGTRRDVAVAGGLTAAVFLVPLVLIGAPDYASGDWRRAVLWSAFALLVAPVIQQVVEQLAIESQRARLASAQTDGILRGARLSSMIATDVNGTITSFGVGAQELLGYDAANLVGKHDPGVFHLTSEVLAAAEELGVEPGFAVFAELARRSAPSRIWTYVRADGAHIFVRLALTVLMDEHGHPTGYLGVAIDSTEAVQSERALATAEARWQVLLEHLPDLTVMTVDENLIIRVVAGGGAMRQGIRGFEGRPLSDVAKAGNMVTLRDAFTRVFAGEDVAAVLNGTVAGVEHEVMVTLLPSEADGARAMLLARDVSNDRARERAVVSAMKRAERLFSDAPHGVAVLDTAGFVIRINAALASIIGHVPGGIGERSLGILSAPGDDQFERHLTDACAHPGQLAETDWTLCAADGKEVQVFLSSRVLLGEGSSQDLVLVNVVDVSERRRYERRLAHLADHDVLTGLANRRRFDEELVRHLEHCDRYGPKGAVLLLDLDNFKEVNDTLGHGAGDQLIISTAALLQRGVRGTDVVARLGGDEFAILLTEADRLGAEAVAKSIVNRVREFTATLDGTRHRVTASVGVVTMKAAREQSADVLALADMTMYDAKDAGRDGYVVLDEANHRPPRTGARLQWKGRIERALENDDFELYLQPILDLHTNTIQSAEVLLRLCDAEEMVLPGRFLYIAERAGLAPSVDQWVVAQSVEMLARLRRLSPDFGLEVNLSGHSIGDPGTERAIVEALGEHAVDPSALILEITETAAVSDFTSAREFAERMTALGCKFALDDFGAGFGSFYYLKHLLFDYVKIDGEFVAESHRSDIDRTIMRSIVGIARDLGKQTVAEHVSEQAILEVVRAEGVDLAQGNLIGPAMPYDDFVARFMSAVEPWQVQGTF